MKKNVVRAKKRQEPASRTRTPGKADILENLTVLKTESISERIGRLHKSTGIGRKTAKTLIKAGKSDEEISKTADTIRELKKITSVDNAHFAKIMLKYGLTSDEVHTIYMLRESYNETHEVIKNNGETKPARVPSLNALATVYRLVDKDEELLYSFAEHFIQLKIDDEWRMVEGQLYKDPYNASFYNSDRERIRKQPRELAEMIRQWLKEAASNGELPADLQAKFNLAGNDELITDPEQREIMEDLISQVKLEKIFRR